MAQVAFADEDASEEVRSQKTLTSRAVAYADVSVACPCVDDEGGAGACTLDDDDILVAYQAVHIVGACTSSHLTSSLVGHASCALGLGVVAV